jgi:hypothetical protein
VSESVRTVFYFFFLTSIAIKRPIMNQRTFMDDYYRLPDRNGCSEARQSPQSLVIEEIENRCRKGKKTKRIHILDDDVHKGFKKAQLFFQTASRNASSRTNQHRNLQSQQQRKKEVYKTHTGPLVFWSLLTRV